MPVVDHCQRTLIQIQICSNIPSAPTYGEYISELIRYLRIRTIKEQETSRREG
jgi:hypothetical protein